MPFNQWGLKNFAVGNYFAIICSPPQRGRGTLLGRRKQRLAGRVTDAIVMSTWASGEVCFKRLSALRLRGTPLI